MNEKLLRAAPRVLRVLLELLVTDSNFQIPYARKHKPLSSISLSWVLAAENEAKNSFFRYKPLLDTNRTDFCEVEM